MRQKNWRHVRVGSILLVVSIGFFVVMLGMASRSTDPQGLMTTVGEVSGFVFAIGLTMILYGYIGRKV